jgi:hypothetical protein
MQVFQTIAYQIKDEFGILREFLCDKNEAIALEKAKNFCHNREGCTIVPKQINVYELLGDAPF